MVVAASGAYDAAFGNFEPVYCTYFSDGRWSYYADWFNHDAVRVKADPRNPNVFCCKLGEVCINLIVEPWRSIIIPIIAPCKVYFQDNHTVE